MKGSFGHKKKHSSWRKTCPSTISSTTDVTWIYLGLNPGQHCKKSLSNNSGVTWPMKQECGNIFLNESEHTCIRQIICWIHLLHATSHKPNFYLLLKNWCYFMNCSMIYYSLLRRNRNTSICTRKFQSFFRGVSYILPVVTHSILCEVSVVYVTVSTWTGHCLLLHTAFLPGKVTIYFNCSME